MAALIAYAAGLTTTGLEILSKALNEVFGEVSIQELGKDDLRYCVRMSMKSSSVVLVALDGSSAEACKDIENGLYSSDKYISYNDDKGLASFLNDKYGLNLEIPVDVEDIEIENVPKTTGISEEVLIELRESYEAQLSDRDGLIRGLQATIRGLEKELSECGIPVDDGALDALREENMSLRSQVSDLQSTLDGYKAMGIHSDEEYNDVLDKLSALQVKFDSLRSEYNKVSQECTEAQMDGSRKSGVLRDKEAEIEKLSKRVSELSSVLEKHKDCNIKISQAELTISALSRDVNGLSADVTAKQNEIDRLTAELKASGKTQVQLEEYRGLISVKEAECSQLTGKLSEAEESLSKALSEYNSVFEERNKLATEVDDLTVKLAKSEEYITELNTKNVQLNGRIRVLEQSTDRDVSMEDTLAELAEARRKVATLQNNVFSVLYSKAMPKSASKAMLFNTLGIRFKNIRFVFSGSTESRKGTYKCILNEIRQDTSGNKYLFVDVVSETFVDYVFEIHKTVNGLKWFTDGGGVQQYITHTCISNARVLSPGLGYINDSFYLAVNWEKRLQELERSGYKVIVYCGDVSNIVGRVLFENFADIGKTDVYVHGNSVGSRTILGVSRGISNIKNATIKYFEYDPQVSRFVDHMRQRCACEVVSSISR